MPEAKAPTAEEGALADVERLVDRLLSRSLDRPGIIMEIDISELRRALGRASQEHLDGVMRLADGSLNWQSLVVGLALLSIETCRNS